MAYHLLNIWSRFDSRGTHPPPPPPTPPRKILATGLHKAHSRSACGYFKGWFSVDYEIRLVQFDSELNISLAVKNKFLGHRGSSNIKGRLFNLDQCLAIVPNNSEQRIYFG